MTCKDCLCSDVCIETRDQIQMLAYQSRNDVEKVCSNFKDKSRFLNIGDKIYQHDSGRIYESTIKNIIYETTGITFDERAISKTVFLTREEAEKALERSGDHA